MKHRMKSAIYLSIYLSLLALGACTKDEVSDMPPELTIDQTIGDQTLMELGEKLDNPYSVENMKAALYELQAEPQLKSSTIGDFEIETTHLYVRFLPNTEDELDILKQDTLLELYDYPLDYEIKTPGLYYQDPLLPDSAITWQYTVVAPNYVFPDVKYEVLAELFIVEDDDETADDDIIELKSGSVSVYDWEYLEDKALEITGNLDEEDKEEVGAALRRRRSKWRPAGRIQVWDDNFSAYVGVEGVKVRARRWFTTHTGIANSSGDYSCNGRFRRPANYSIKWERYHFSIRSGTIGQAKYDGSKKKGNWNLDIKGGKSQYYATIFRAAYHYYYGNIRGLRRPPQNSFWKPQMKIAAIYKDNDDRNGRHAASLRVFGLFNWIKIWNPNHDCDDIYGTTIHELAHASHWNMNHSDFNNTDLIVKESWARGVQWVLTRLEYPNYSISYSRLDYTGVVQDMLDGNKTTRSYYHSKYDTYSSKLYSDQVSGYSIKQIEDALKGQKNWNSWRDNIKNKYNNGTENNLDAAFSYWNTK